MDGQVHTNGLENFWSLLMRGLGGTYVSVRPFHLFRYLDEQVYRCNKREMSNAERVAGVLSGIDGKRVTWKMLTGKEQHPEPAAPEPPQRRRRRVYPTRPFRELKYQ